MAVDMFLKSDEIKGESADKNYKGAIDLLAWSWGMSQTGTTHHGTGGGAGKANFQDISITKYIDISSPNIMFCCSAGKHISKAKLIVRKAGENPLDYVNVDMEDIIITSYSTGGSGNEERLTENVTLNFARVKVTYASQDKSGKKAETADYGWDIAANAKY